LKLVPPATVEERAGRIRTYFGHAGTAYAMSAFYAIMAGLELIAAKGQVEHGQWEEWVREKCGFNPSTGWRLMEAARRKAREIANLAHVQDFISENTTLASLEATQRQALLDSVRDSTGGQSYRQLLIELGMLVDPRNRGGDHGGGAARAQMSDSEKRDRASQMARDEWEEIEKKLSLWCAKHRWEHLEALDLQRARQSLDAALAMIPKPVFPRG